MSNLKNYSDLFADLAQGAYNGRPKEYSFPSERLTSAHQKELKEKGYAEYNFGDGVKTVYLQPDKTLHTEKVVTNIQVPKVNGGYETQSYITDTYQKGLLTDEKAGYNSYFVTDKPTVKDSKETYFVTRGSDGISMENLNDWVSNNARFTLFNSYIPQAKLAEKAMEAKIKELPKGATMNVTGHSLGTMVSIQAVANLPAGDIDKIGRVVLFQGPDARESINKMSKQARENIEKLEAQGKIDYYVSPFDIVSMLNRNKKGVDEIGNVHYLMPISGTNTLQTDALHGSSHDFGQYQFNKDGSIKEANVKDNPEIFEAGIRVSRLIDETMAQIVKKAPQIAGSATLTAVLTSMVAVSGRVDIAKIVAASGGKLTKEQAMELYDTFMKKYNGIIKDTEISMKRNSEISNLKSSISTSTGGQKVKLRAELAGAVAEEAKSYGREYNELVKNCQQETEDEIDQIVREVYDGAHGSAIYLSYYEVEELIQSFEKDRLWDNSQAADNLEEAKKYKEKLDKFSSALKDVSKNIQTYDGAAGKSLFNEKPKTVLEPWNLHF